MDNILCLDSFTIIDIRSVEDYEECHIPNSINVPHPSLLEFPEKYLSHDVNYLIICDEGVTSKIVVKLLPQYKMTSFEGGILFWKGPTTNSCKP